MASAPGLGLLLGVWSDGRARCGRCAVVHHKLRPLLMWSHLSAEAFALARLTFTTPALCGALPARPSPAGGWAALLGFNVPTWLNTCLHTQTPFNGRRPVVNSLNTNPRRHCHALDARPTTHQSLMIRRTDTVASIQPTTWQVLPLGGLHCRRHHPHAPGSHGALGASTHGTQQ